MHLSRMSYNAPVLRVSVVDGHLALQSQSNCLVDGFRFCRKGCRVALLPEARSFILHAASMVWKMKLWAYAFSFDFSRP